MAKWIAENPNAVEEMCGDIELDDLDEFNGIDDLDEEDDWDDDVTGGHSPLVDRIFL